MRRSRAAALLIGDYIDRTIDASLTVNIPAATGLTVGFTYTVGANIQGIIRATFLWNAITGAVANTMARFQVNRNGTLYTLDRSESLVAQPVKSAMAYSFPLMAGDSVQFQYLNGGVAPYFVEGAIFIDEIDL